MIVKVSDKDFLDAWEKHKSPVALANLFNISERRIHSRRRSLESKLKIKLSSERLIESHIKKSRHYAGLTDGIAIVFSDAHFWPGIRSTAFKGLLWAIDHLKPHIIVNNGDAFDGASISRYPRIGWTSQPSVKQELEACQEALGEIEKAAHKARHHTQLIWPLGNHDSRFETKLAQSASEFEGVQGTALQDH
jgi:hypothetical protein